MIFNLIKWDEFQWGCIWLINEWFKANSLMLLLCARLHFIFFLIKLVFKQQSCLLIYQTDFFCFRRTFTWLRFPAVAEDRSLIFGFFFRNWHVVWIIPLGQAALFLGNESARFLCSYKGNSIRTKKKKLQDEQRRIH